MNDLAIVTSSVGYGRYLGEWAESLIKLATKPAQVGIFTHGTPEDERAGAAAVARLTGAGIDARHVHHAEQLDFGEARNRAVALTDTAWVMHLDADDLAMPHLVDEIAKLAPQADVVALGYERSGDRAAGPNQRTKTYRSSQGLTTLANPTPASGVSPFRRSFWERSPYRTDLIGGWDTALWIGFAHLGARFLPTRRPCFWYRQHADSTFNTRRLDPWETRRAGTRFTALRRGDRGVTVIVPRASDGGARDRAWAFVCAWYAREHPDWQLLEGVAAGVWCKGAAITAALTQASGEILVIADADSLVPADGLREAVRLVESRIAAWVVPHTQVHRLSQETTTKVLAQVEPPFGTTDKLARPPYRGFAGGGIVVVPREGYDLSGGIPQAFKGWGGEDEALAVILDAIVGPHVRLPNDLVHLWHPPAMGRHGNRDLVAHYRAAASDPAAIRALVLGGGTIRPGLDPLSRAAERRTQIRNTHRAQVVAEIARRQAMPVPQPKAVHVPNGFKRGEEERARKRLALREEQKERRAELLAKVRRTPIANKMMPGPTEDKEAVVR